MNSNSLVGILDDILVYCVNQVKYEQQIKEKLALYNKAKVQFLNESKINHVITKELALSKIKLQILKKRTSNISDEYKPLITNLISDLENHIETLRQSRVKNKP